MFMNNMNNFPIVAIRTQAIISLSQEELQAITSLSQEELGVKQETEERLREMDLNLRQQIKTLGGNKIFSKIFELLSLDQMNR